jgi:hypothetical protein
LIKFRPIGTLDEYKVTRGAIFLYLGLNLFYILELTEWRVGLSELLAYKPYVGKA